MKKSIIIIGIVAIIMAITCPNKQAHQETIKATLTNLIEKELSSDDDIIGYEFFGSMIAGKLLEVILEEKLTVNNYILFSVGKIQYKDEVKHISFGILNQVFTFDEDDLQKELDNH